MLPIRLPLTFLITFISLCTLFFSENTWAANTPILEKIKQTNSITLGYREASMPFSYLDAQNQPIGFSIDLCNDVVTEIKKRLHLPNLKINYLLVNSSNRIPLVQNKRIDIECGGTAIYPYREKEVDFSLPIFVIQSKWLVRKDSGINKINDLKEKVVVATQGSDAVPLAKRINEEKQLHFQLIQTKDHAESMLMLATKRASAYLDGDIILAAKKAMAKNPDDFYILEESYQPVYGGLMLAKGNPDLKAIINATIQHNIISGKFEQDYQKWFKQRIPPKNIRLDINMPILLQQYIQDQKNKMRS